MTARPEFEFVTIAACQNTVRKACPQVATNIPGVVALRDSERPGEVVTMTREAWAEFTSAIRCGEFDLSA
ncbi:DUF397 domain-containing protein [Kitasatospora sp. NPDC059088]|uniref:DUF397 domain-containing protein n=1 Tax=Kitasatospora sp. NPDC059088 TaxID=3346722 RepID=UPI0036A4547A